jgi:hypothetical protein
MPTPTIKAIETRAYGCRFRSRLEARWAVFFTAMGLRWEYEPEGFELPSGRYLPDFKVWDPNTEDRYGNPGFYWVECKGGSPTQREIKLARELSAATRSAVAFFEPQLLEYIRQLHLGRQRIKTDPHWRDIDAEEWYREPVCLQPITPQVGNNIVAEYITARPCGNGEWIQLWDRYSEVQKEIGWIGVRIPQWPTNKAFAAVNQALKARFEHGASWD